MLQINTGRFYANGVGRTNQLRGVLYSNARILHDGPVVTAAGTLQSTDVLGGGRALIYEMEERIEKVPDGSGVLISHGIDPFLVDFAAVASFALNAIVVPELAEAERLLSDKPTLASYAAPAKFLGHCFDEGIIVVGEDVQAFTTFVARLIGLERRSFLAAMRAIRTYVAGVHRLRDDLGTAYTLMVSAVESLAQRFDEFATTWTDVDERRRKPIDAALEAATADLAGRVRDAVISTEHASLGRRYRAFVKEHVGPGYYRGREAGGPLPLAADELDQALREAYILRSRHLHNLSALPDELTHPVQHWEVVRVDGAVTLTINGLARLTRHVITEFVNRGRQVEAEDYDYSREVAGIVFMPVAPQYWVGAPMLDAGETRSRFEGLLMQLVAAMTATPGATLTDLRPVLAQIEAFLPAASPKKRGPMLALYGLFNNMVHSDLRMPRFVETLRKYGPALLYRSPEALVALTLTGDLATWSVDEHRQALDDYAARSATAKGLRVPRVFEAAMRLALAERYRAVGDLAEASALVARAVESMPGNEALSALERDWVGPDEPIDWRAVLLPRSEGHGVERAGGTEPGELPS